MGWQETPREKSIKGKKIIDGKCKIRFKDGIYKYLLQLSETKQGYKLVKDNKFKKIDGKPVIFAINHTRCQDTPVSCQMVDDVIGERAYIVAGVQDLNIEDNVFFNLYGSIFCKRKDKEDGKYVQSAMEEYLKLGRSIIIFPEATWNLSPNKLMNRMRWGIVKVSQNTGAQIIPTVFFYDDDTMSCHIKFGEPVVVKPDEDKKNAIDSIRDTMSTMLYGYIEQNRCLRSSIDVDAENNKIQSVLAEYPKYNRQLEQSYIYKPAPDAEEVFSPIRQLVKRKVQNL